MRRLVPLIVLAACGGDDAPPTGAMTIEVRRYDYAFDLETREAHAALSIGVTGEGNCLTLPVRADVNGDVLLDGVMAEVTRDGDSLIVCGAGWRVDDELTLDVDVTVPLETWGASQVGFSITETGQYGPFYYLVSWVGGCDRFTPCDTTPGAFARYRFVVSHPEGMTVLCPGDITAGDTETVCEFEHDGGPTYSTFGIMASSDWVTADHGEWAEGVNVIVYERAGSGANARISDATSGGFLQWMVDRFGAYPYGDELRLVMGPTYWNGFEHPGNVTLFEGLSRPLDPFPQPDAMNRVIEHEITHMWAGDQATLAGTYDFTWKEAMAEYLPSVYITDVRPQDVAPIARYWKTSSVGAAHYPVPEDEPELLDYYGDAYGAGVMILFWQLEHLFSREQVMEAIGTLLGQPRALTITEVELALEEATGADLSGYFDRWLHGSGAPTWPEFAIALNDTGADVEVTVNQLRPEDGLYGCAFDVELRGATVDERAEVHFDLGVDGTEQATEIAVAPGFDPVTAVLDPHSTCLAFPPGTAAAAQPHAPGWSPWLSSRL